MYGVLKFKKAIYEYSNRFVSKWLVLFIDLIFVAVNFIFAYLIVKEFDVSRLPVADFKFEVPIVLGVYLLTFIITKSFHGVIRHTSLADGWKILLSCILSTSIFIGLDFILHKGSLGQSLHVAYIPRMVVVMHALINVIILFSIRLIFKIVYFKFVSGSRSTRNVMIYGAGNSGITTLNSLKAQNASIRYRIVGFFDDNPTKINKTIQGYKVYDPQKNLDKVIQSNEIDEVIFAIHNIAKRKKRKIVSELIAHNIETKIIPPINQWIDGEIDATQIKTVKIEDLLGRDTINLDRDNIFKQVENKTVMVTGGAGSIGSEIVRQLLGFLPKKIVILDQSETGVFEIENEIRELQLSLKTEIAVVPTIADVSNVDRLEIVFEEHNIDIIYHAAAYKHVPMMEKNPSEAINCNVRGTKNLADLAVKKGVEKFVMISTDKAVNPTNVMGASKRIAEIYVQTLNQYLQAQGKSSIKFITTRFGNVLGSNGSVIPIFRKQIAEGGPVKVTHPDITRYFMTIPEACQLVLEAGAMGTGGEIFIFDMGESVKILDLANKMIRLSGLTPGEDIEIEFTGLREGEKLYEELLNSKEKTTPTHHEKIMIAKVRNDDYDAVRVNVDKLKSLAEEPDMMAMVRQMKQIVPEYLSQNSVFESIDLESKL